MDKTATNTMIGKITLCTGNVMQLLRPTSISVWIKCDLSTIVCRSIEQFKFERLACKSVYKQDAGVDWLSMVLRLRQHNISYTADGFYRSDDPTNSVKALKEGG